MQSLACARTYDVVGKDVVVSHRIVRVLAYDDGTSCGKALDGAELQHTMS